ncbi:hypothetical protein RhiirA4_421350 [Rhizophagus irregularis]|uniref:Uncharacterized protein n=1 Tax=Rhizophagus irregularis TaxID=588596 RepID=A0A2I1GL81_9GLOM|nr:hypothetical protein RhiirA4_421350 [Rhizophagus irregularis]
MVLLVDKDDYNGNGCGRSPDHNKYDEFNKKITKEETSQTTKSENEDNKFTPWTEIPKKPCKLILPDNNGGKSEDQASISQVQMSSSFSFIPISIPLQRKIKKVKIRKRSTVIDELLP